MATLNFSANNDVVVPTVDGTTYRGQNGDDTYILVSQAEGSKVSVTDTEGDNTIQLPEWSKIKSVVTNNGITDGKITFTVPADAPDTLFYNCQYHEAMTGIIYVVDTEGSNLITGGTGSGGGGYGYSFDLETVNASDISNDNNNIIFDSLII